MKCNMRPARCIKQNLIYLISISLLVSCIGNQVAAPVENRDTILVTPPNTSVRFESPDWSPDSNKLSVYGECDYLYIIDLKNNNIHSLENSILCGTSNQWSPKRDEILYVGQHTEGGLAVWIQDISRPTTTPILFSEGNRANWSPDGNQIVIGRISDQDDFGYQFVEVLIFNRNGDFQKTVFQRKGKYLSIYDLEWSPDGNYLAFWLSQNPTGDLNNLAVNSLLIVNLKNGEEVIEYGNISVVGGVNWSRDSKKLIYQSSTDLNLSKFQVVDLKGNCSQIMASIGLILEPTISPNGSWLAYSGRAGGIYVIDTEKVFGSDYWNAEDTCEPEP